MYIITTLKPATQNALRKGKYIRALVLQGFDLSLRDGKLAVHNKDGIFEGEYQTALEACGSLLR